MNDLTDLLDRAAGPANGPADPSADLRRGRRALARVRLRNRAAATVGVAAVGAVAFGSIGLREPTVGPSAAARAAHVHLVAQSFTAGSYTFATTPVGWEVQGQTADHVTIAPTDGSASTSVDDFRHKLVIMFDGNPQTDGQHVRRDGRDFLVRGDSGYTTLVTATLPSEPEGHVIVQFPDDAGWDRTTMLDFLASVRVGPDAVVGLG